MGHDAWRASGHVIDEAELSRLWTPEQIGIIRAIDKASDQLRASLKGRPKEEIEERVANFGWDALLQQSKTEEEFIQSWFKIRVEDEGNPLVTIKFNYGQRVLHQHIQRMEREKKPVRILVLKARRLGFSTFVQMYLTKRVLTQAMFRCAVIAHDKAPAMELFGMSSRVVDMLPFKPAMKTDRRDEIQTTKGGKYTVVTANNDQVTRGLGVNWLHLSEFAFYENAEVVHDAVMQTVSRKSGTGIIIESTANGMDNLFYELWAKAERGENDWFPLFVPWWQGAENRMDVPEDLADRVLQALDEDERYAMKQYKLGIDQMAWLLWVRRNNCRNNADIRKQEYPSFSMEAFLSSGRPVFDQRRIEELRRKCTLPYFQGHLVWSQNGRQFPNRNTSTATQ